MDLLAAAAGLAGAAALGGHQATTALVAYGLFAAVEHVFLIAPPLLPLGLILLRTPLLPPAFAWLAVLLGASGPILSLAGLVTVTANNGPTGAGINALLTAQGLWIAAASIITLACEISNPAVALSNSAKVNPGTACPQAEPT